MHLSLNLEYPWILQLTTDELDVLQRVLRDDELSEEEELRLEKLSSTIDLIRGKAERSGPRYKLRRNGPRYSSEDQSASYDEQYSDETAAE